MEVMKMRCSEPPFTPCFSPNNVHTTTPAAVTPLSPSTPPNSVPPPPPPKASPESATAVVASPCAACKILRRRCSAEKCLLAPYFPPTDPLKFATAHKVFGASNIMKLLQELPENQRADAVSSMVYEANARLRDPVYGSAGAICQLQKQLSQLQAELAKAQAELLNMKCQQSHLLAMLYMNPTTPANSDPDSSNSDPDGFFNFYPDPPNSSLITSWDLATLIE